MDQNSKENLPSSEPQPQPEVSVLPSMEAEPAEGFSVESGIISQPPVESQPELPPAPQEYSEAEINKQAGEVAQLPESDRLAQLKSVALKEGVVKAVRITKKMGDPRLLDELHDAIQDDPELKAQLEAMGKLEKL